MFRRHKWNRPRRKATTEPPFCTVCHLQSSFYHYNVADKFTTWVSDSGEVWGSHVAIRHPRAGLWCKGVPQSTEAFRV